MSNNHGFHEIDHFELDVYAVKNELQTDRVDIHQSGLARRHFKYEPLVIKKLEAFEANRVSAKRLHFAATTKNNKFLNREVNPMQRYFILVVEFKAVTTDGQNFIIYSVESERIIVRVSELFFVKFNKKRKNLTKF